MHQIRLNDACRQLDKPFYAGGTYGLLGYIFCDLLQHDYIAPYVVHVTDCRSLLTGGVQGQVWPERRRQKRQENRYLCTAQDGAPAPMDRHDEAANQGAQPGHCLRRAWYA